MVMVAEPSVALAAETGVYRLIHLGQRTGLRLLSWPLPYQPLDLESTVGGLPTSWTAAAGSSVAASRIAAYSMPSFAIAANYRICPFP